MKPYYWQKMLAFLFVTSLTSPGVTAFAQDSSLPSPAPPATINQSAPLLGYGAAQILQLAQAKLSEDAMIAYIKHSGNRYRLNADQIIYLRQQGISDPVITAMLNQPAVGLPVALPTAPAAQPLDSTGYPEPVTPATPYVPTVPDADYYYPPPDYVDQPYYYYPACVSYPAVTFYYGWGGGGGRVWQRGGYYGGGYGGGGYRVASSVEGGYRGGSFARGGYGGYRGGGVVLGGSRGTSFHGSSGGGHVGGGQGRSGHVGGHR